MTINFISTASYIQVLAIEFVTFAIEFVTLAIEFVPLAIEFITLAIEFVALARKFVHNKIGGCSKDVAAATRPCSGTIVVNNPL